MSLHSMLTRLSRTLGGRTRSLGTGVRPETVNSSTSGEYSPEHKFICWAISSLTMFTTNSCVARTLARVSFGGLRCVGEKHTTGGSPQIALKKLNGATL